MTRRSKGREMLARLAMSRLLRPDSSPTCWARSSTLSANTAGWTFAQGRGRDLEREYVEGMYWDGALLNRDLSTDLPAHARASWKMRPSW